MPSEVPAFVIRELTGARRAVSLRDRALPYRPLTMEGLQRVKVTFPSGSPEGHGTITGPTEEETEIEGMWKDIFIGTNLSGRPMILMMAPRSGANTAGEMTPVGTVVEAIELIDSMRTDGQQVEVEWGPIRRRGFIKKFRYKYHNIHDAEWSIQFIWTSKGAAPSRPSYGSVTPSQLDTGGSLRESVSRLLRVLDAPGEVVGSAMADFRNTINRVTDASIAIDQTVAGLFDTTAPRNIVGPIQGLLGNVVADATTVMTSFENSGWAGLFTDFRTIVPYSQHIATTNPRSAFDAADAQALNDIDPVQVLQAQLYASEGRRDARNLRDEAEIRRRALLTEDGTFIGIYRARGNEDLRAVSRLYFGTPDQWRQIMLDNALTESILEDGQELRIYRHDEDQR